METLQTLDSEELWGRLLEELKQLVTGTDDESSLVHSIPDLPAEDFSKLVQFIQGLCPADERLRCLWDKATATTAPIHVLSFALQAQLQAKDNQHQAQLKANQAQLQAKDNQLKAKDNELQAKDETINDLTERLETGAGKEDHHLYGGFVLPLSNPSSAVGIGNAHLLGPTVCSATLEAALRLAAPTEETAPEAHAHDVADHFFARRAANMRTVAMERQLEDATKRAGSDGSISEIFKNLPPGRPTAPPASAPPVRDVGKKHPKGDEDQSEYDDPDDPDFKPPARPRKKARSALSDPRGRYLLQRATRNSSNSKSSSSRGKNSLARSQGSSQASSQDAASRTSAAKRKTLPEAVLASTFVRGLNEYLGEDGHAYQEEAVQKSYVDCLVCEARPRPDCEGRPLFAFEFKACVGPQKRENALAQVLAYENNLAFRDMAQRLATTGRTEVDGMETLCLPWVMMSLTNDTMTVDLMLVGNFNFRQRSFVCHLWTEKVTARRRDQWTPECRNALVRVMRTVKHWCASTRTSASVLALTRVRPDSDSLKKEFVKRWNGKTVLKLPKSALKGLVGEREWKEMEGWKEECVAVKHFRAKPSLGRPGFTRDGKRLATATISRSWSGFEKFMDARVLVEVFDVRLVIYPWREGSHRPTRVGHLLSSMARLHAMHEAKWVHGDVRAFNLLFHEIGTAPSDAREEEVASKVDPAEFMTTLLDFDFARSIAGGGGEAIYPDGYNVHLKDVERHKEAISGQKMLPQHDAFALWSIFCKFEPQPQAEEVCTAWQNCLQALQPTDTSTGLLLGEHYEQLVPHWKVQLVEKKTDGQTLDENGGTVKADGSPV